MQRALGLWILERVRECVAVDAYFIPADDFFEWTKSPVDGGIDLWHIFLPGPKAFLFADL